MSGMAQDEARQLARTVDGVARLARPRADGSWLFGGWPSPGQTWVVELSWGEVLAAVPGR